MIEQDMRLTLARQETEIEREIWTWLDGKKQSYQQYVPALKQSTRKEPDREYIVCRLIADDKNSNNPIPIRLLWYEPVSGLSEIDLTADDAIEQLTDLMQSCSRSKRWLMFLDGQRFAFHLVLRHLAKKLLDNGYSSITPLATSTSLKLLKLRRGRRSVSLCDIQAVTGVPQETLETSFWYGPCASELELTYYALWAYQTFTQLYFGVALHATYSAAALLAARRHLPTDWWLWRPSPLLVAMCRAGGAFRGGYVYARPYSGIGYKSDVNKLYASCLRTDLPLRSCLSYCYDTDGNERPGIYICYVVGPGDMAVPLAVWQGSEKGFVRQYWHGQGISDDGCICILPTNEIEGLRELGYTVHPRYGFRWTRMFNLSSYVALIQQITAEHERGTAQHIVAKLFGNSIWGKWAENPKQVEIRYADKRPEGGWLTMIDDEAAEVPHVWIRSKTTFKSHQQVHLAAVITSEARNVLFRGLHTALLAGAEVVYSDTDSIITDRPLDGYLYYCNEIGQWRLEGFEQTTILAAKQYLFGDEARIAGMRATRQAVEIAIRDGEVIIHGKRLNAPWMSNKSMNMTHNSILHIDTG